MASELGNDVGFPLCRFVRKLVNQTTEKMINGEKGEVALGGVGEMGTLKTALRAQYKTPCNLHN